MRLVSSVFQTARYGYWGSRQVFPNGVLLLQALLLSEAPAGDLALIFSGLLYHQQNR
jgi:hypothetical protein